MMQYSVASAGQYYFHIHDHLGNTRVVVDADKNVVERYDYYPFGSVSRSSVNSSIETIQKFTGKELDDEHGLDLYYPPGVGPAALEHDTTTRSSGGLSALIRWQRNTLD